MSNGNIVQLRGPMDHLRYGFSSMQRDALQLHPVQLVQRSYLGVSRAKLESVSRTYGSHMAMRLATEQSIFSRPHRLPGLESSHQSIDTILGKDNSITFADFLGGMFYTFSLLCA